MKLLSFGEILWDVYGEEKTLAGAPLNFAAYVKLLGNSVWLASAVGMDELGEKALEIVGEMGIRTEYVSVLQDLPSGQCLVSLNENGIPTYNLLENTAYDHIRLEEKLVQKFDVISFGTLALRKKENYQVLERTLANNSFQEIYTDLNLRAPFYSKKSIEFCLSRGTMVKISEEELPFVTETLLGTILPTEEAIKKLVEKYKQIKLLLLTCGANGAFCYDLRKSKKYYCSAQSATVVSTVGAGDSFGAAFLSEYYKTGDIPSALTLASKISAFVVSNKEAIPPQTKDFIKTLYVN